MLGKCETQFDSLRQYISLSAFNSSINALFWFSRTATRFSKHLTYSFFFRRHSFAASLFLSRRTCRFRLPSSLSLREVKEAEPCRLAIFAPANGLWLPPPEFPYDKSPDCQSEKTLFWEKFAIEVLSDIGSLTDFKLRRSLETSGIIPFERDKGGPGMWS